MAPEGLVGRMSPLVCRLVYAFGMLHARGKDHESPVVEGSRVVARRVGSSRGKRGRGKTGTSTDSQGRVFWRVRVPRYADSMPSAARRSANVIIKVIGASGDASKPSRTARLGRGTRADAGLGPPPTACARLRARLSLGSARLLVAAVSLAGNGAAPLVCRWHAAPQMPLPAPWNACAYTVPTSVSPAVGR